MTTPEPSEDQRNPSKPRATVARVDFKIEQILEEMDGIRIEMSQIRSALKELAEVLKPAEKPDDRSIGSHDFGMFG